jgi:hypothetical protein
MNFERKQGHESRLHVYEIYWSPGKAGLLHPIAKGAAVLPIRRIFGNIFSRAVRTSPLLRLPPCKPHISVSTAKLLLHPTHLF